jgi:PAS domain S-box-containing protein
MAKDGIGTAEAQTDKQGKLRAESDLDMLRILVDSIMEYAIIMLDPKGNMVSWSPAAERLKGYSASEVVGKNFSIFATPEDASASKTDVELKTAVREGRSEDEGGGFARMGRSSGPTLSSPRCWTAKARTRDLAWSPAISASARKRKSASRGKPKRSSRWPP